MPWHNFLIAWVLQTLRQFWAGRGAPLSVLLEKITWQRVVFGAVLLLAAYAFAQVVSLDMALLMAGDVAFYCEIATAVMFITVKGHIRQSVHAARIQLAQVTRRARLWCRRAISVRRRRTLKSPATRDKGADDDGGWLPGFPGFALQF